MAPAGSSGRLACLLVAGIALVSNGPTETGAATLTEAAPVACFPLDLGATPPDSAVARLEVASVSNPDLEGLTFSVYLERDGNRWDVGAFSLYPPDRPGVFRLRLDGALRAAEAQTSPATGAPIRICIALNAPMKGDAKGAPVAVRLLAPAVEAATARP
jgi:hypothetical protein